MARLFFCFIPALLVAVLIAIINPETGVLAFMAMFLLGWQLTEARPDRGEGYGD